MHPITKTDYVVSTPHFRQRKVHPHPTPPAGTLRAWFNNAPVRALSLKQPWAWLMSEGHKVDENRSKKWDVLIGSFVLLHAAERLRDGDYQNCVSFMESRNIFNITMPAQDQLKVGGFVGIAYVEFCGDEARYRYNNITPDRFFTGPFAYRMACRPIDFIQAQGCNGLWMPALTQEQWNGIISTCR